MPLWDVIPYPGPDPNRHVRMLPIPLVPHSVAFIMVVSTTVLLLFFLKVGGIGDIWTGVDNCEHLLVISLNVDCNKQFSKCGSDYNWLSLTSAFRAAFKHCYHYVYATVQHISMLWVHGDISFVTELFDYQGTVQLAVSYAAVLKFHTATNRLLYSTWCNVRIQLRRCSCSVKQAFLTYCWSVKTEEGRDCRSSLTVLYLRLMVVLTSTCEAVMPGCSVIVLCAHQRLCVYQGHLTGWITLTWHQSVCGQEPGIQQSCSYKDDQLKSLAWTIVNVAIHYYNISVLHKF